MNHLAHLFLAEPTVASRVGNLAGDWFKGLIDKQPAELRRGIAEHRFIDAFTDSHPAARRARAALRPSCGILSSVVLDVAFDCILTRQWARWCDQPLRLFADDVYASLRAGENLVPVEFRIPVRRMIGGDWLLRNADLEGVGRTLAWLAMRLRRDAALPGAMAALPSLMPLLEAEFEEFFAELQQALHHSRGGAPIRPISP